MNFPFIYIIIFIFSIILLFLSLGSGRKIKLQHFVNWLFNYRYFICLVIVISIMLLGCYLYFFNHWGFKDVSQVSTGFFIVITLFFTALNYEFAASKTKNDIQSAKNTLTFNTAGEWHKSPIKDYERTVCEFEKPYIAAKAIRSIQDFNNFIEDPNNTSYKQALKGILNHLESISIATRKGLIDKDFIREFHQAIYKLYFLDYWYYIDDHRQAREDETIWINFTNLAEEWLPGIRDKLLAGTEKSSLINT
jgi:hypothetical protein